MRQNQENDDLDSHTEMHRTRILPRIEWIYMCACMHICVYACIGLCVQCIWMCVCVHACLCMFMQVCVYVCMHVRVHACMYVCMHTYWRHPSGLKLAKSWISNSDNRSKKLKSQNVATGAHITHYIEAL